MEHQLLSQYLPFWNKLSPQEQSMLEQSAVLHQAEKGKLLHNGSADCFGVIVVTQGVLRVFTHSEEGREITLYRLLERDICIFSAPCMMSGGEVELSVSAEQDSQFVHVPVSVYRQLMEQSAAVSNYTSQLITARFSDVLWLVNQILYQKMDSRLAGFLLEQSRLLGTDVLSMTHEEMARHLGTAREVITRMLKYLQSENLVSLSRGTVTLLEPKQLEELAGNSLR